MAFWISVAPIVFLVVVMTKKRAWPSHLALPATALIVYLVRLLYFEAPPNLTNATLIQGALEALTPLSIIWAAILLSSFMEATGHQAVANRWLNGVSRNPVAQLMLIGWAFSFMLEGASGFGTPAAIAAPILVAMGFPPLRVAIATLIMNTVPVSFGAVGTPTWFGFGELGLAETELLRIAYQGAAINSAAALTVPVIALAFVVDRAVIRRNLLFVYLSILSCTVPMLLLARINYEFPALVGGAIGLVTTVLLARFKIGLHKGDDPGPSEQAQDSRLDVIRAFSPYLLLIVVLIATRVPAFGLRPLLRLQEPAADLALGTLGHASASVSLVLRLDEIFTTPVSWAYETLYVPALIPFVLVVLISLPLLGAQKAHLGQAVNTASQRLKLPALTLVGALAMVKLMMSGGESSMTVTIGRQLAEVSGSAWQYVASLMGALGSFFSGSASVSNLTFGAIQQSIAEEAGLDLTHILALQSAGAAMGNMVCINNIVAVCAILGIRNQEGHILSRTAIPLVVYALTASLMSLLL